MYAYNFILSAHYLFIYLIDEYIWFVNERLNFTLRYFLHLYVLSVTVLTWWVAPPKCSAIGIGFNGAETNCGIARILGILLMNSCDT